MTKPEADTLLTRLTEAYDRKMGTGRRAIYLQRFEEWDYDIARRAINNAIDTEDHFPSISKLLERCQYYAGLKPAAQQAPEEIPMTPGELQEAAEAMAREAADRLTRHNGKPDVYSRLLEQGAHIYAQNAQRRARGLPTLPLPKIDTVIAGLATDHRITDANEDA